MEANTTITYVDLSNDQLTDEGKEASLLGMKEVNLNSVVLVGARFIRLASKGAGKHLTERWYNVGTTSCIFSPSSEIPSLNSHHSQWSAFFHQCTSDVLCIQQCSSQVWLVLFLVISARP